jgi:predicted aspartyl protease
VPLPTLKWVILWLSGPLLLGCGGVDEERPCTSLGGGRSLCGSQSATVPTISNDGSSLVTAKLDGRGVRVLVDTGAEMTTISSALLGATDKTVVIVDELCLGDLCLRGEPVYAWETPFSSGDADAINGFVGMRTLKDFTVIYDHGTSITIEHGSMECAGDSVPIELDEYGIPRVEARVGSLASVSIPVDTGSTFSVIGPASAEALGAGLDPKTLASLCTVDGCQNGVAYTAALSSYCVGSACENDVTVKFPVFDAVGMSFLSRLEARFVFPEKVLQLCR